MRKHWPVIFLILISLVLAYLNYQPHTWLTGWDNLHPEFNFGLNIKRSVFALWQEYQSLGLLGGMAHAADLPHQLVLLLLSQFLPISLLRYIWTFLMLIIGPLGVYALAQVTVLRKFSLPTRQSAGVFAGLFYLLNIGTLQNFYTPYETFVTFYGFLPWVLAALVYYLIQPSRKRLLWFCLVMFLSSPGYYVQTLFVVLVFCIFTFLVTRLFYAKGKAIKPILVILFAILCVNAYWLFPVAYFTVTAAHTTVDAAQNLVATPETISRNQEAGTLQNVPTLKGFWFNYVDLAANNRFGYMMGPWVSHLNTPAIQVISWVLFCLIIIGAIYAVKRKLNYAGAIIGIGILAIFFLINLNPPTDTLFAWLQEAVPLLKQFFRSVYTKWSPVAMLSYSLLFSVGVIFLLDIFSFLHYRFTTIITSFTVILALIIQMAPAFQGNLIYPAMRQNIPQEYFDLFSYMKTQDPNTRLMNLPQHTFWGWEFYSWGYRGSGFLWYGIEQPILDRAFDVWSPYSERYYSEIQHTIYAQNRPELEAIVEKYGVTWILVDDNLIVPGVDDQKTLYLDQIKTMLATSGKISPVKDFGGLHLYKATLESDPQNFILSHNPSLKLEDKNSESTPAASIQDTPKENHSSNDGKAKNCDNFNALSFTQNNTGEEVVYQATKANACDHFLYPQLPHSSSYQFKITHRNLAGSPFFVCVEDYVSKQCLIYRYLPQSTDWTTTTMDIPSMKDGEYGYALHLYTYSLSHQASSNAWKEIEITPGPKATPISLEPLSQPLVTLESTQKGSYSLYTASVEASDPYGVLVLNQSYDPGWKVYVVDDLTLPNLFQQYQVALTRVPLPEINHIQVFGWANGWKIPHGSHKIVVIYTPQLWQFLGFALLPLPLLIGLFLHRRK